MILAPQSCTCADSASTVGRNPVFSGPYKFVAPVQNDRLVLQKFDKYYDAKNFSFDKVTFFAIPDSTVRLSNLRSGGIAILERVTTSDVPSIKQDEPLAFKPLAGLGVRQFMFHVSKGEKSQTNPFINKD